MLESNSPKNSAKEPRTVGVEPVERLAPVFVLPTPPKKSLVQEFESRMWGVEEYLAASPYSAPYIGPEAKEAPPAPSIEESSTKVEGACENDACGCKPDVTPVLDLLHLYEQAELTRAHELEQFKLDQQHDRNCDLYGISLALQEFLAEGGDPLDHDVFQHPVLENLYLDLVKVLGHVD